MNVPDPAGRAGMTDEAGGRSLLDRAAQASELLWTEAENADASAKVSPEALGALHGLRLAMAPFGGIDGGEDLLAPARHDDLVSVLRMLGAGDLSVARLYEGHANAVSLLCRYGTAAQVQRFAGRVEAGALSGVWGADDARGLRANQTDDGWILDGRKILASGADLLAEPLVTAASDSGQLLLWVSLDDHRRADLSGWTAQGMRSSATGAVDLDGIRVSRDQLIGQPGDFMRQPFFSGGAWRFCAVHLGAAERLTDLFRTHLIARGRDTDPYQLQRVAQCVTAVTTAAFWIREAARRLTEEAGNAAVTVAFVNLTRNVTERAALDVLEAVQRGVGLSAFVRPSPIERVGRDLATYLRQPVPDLAMADGAREVLASERATGDLWSIRP